MAGPVQERVTDADKRHFDFIDALLGISEALTEKETANVKLYCMHLIPKGQLAQLTRAADVFHKLIELDKIDQENLDFVEEILERIGRPNLIRDVLMPFQPPDREIPENPDAQTPKFRSPDCGVCVVMSPSNEIFVVDKGNSRVQVHNTEGVYLRDFRTVVPGT
ncbi:Hypp560 [Branchiostoma lanceolatum]|uniref:Hypp560 protein n=1 Tax=Branchiostoma lanceolatum TaxID=7740 RepID=A0A8J9YQ57_BRALA|nr:Hypp560 [Branchiostoma lanceolatum]